MSWALGARVGKWGGFGNKEKKSGSFCCFAAAMDDET